MAEANDELCLLIQVESRTALENLDAILEVDGIDGVFIGPADLSASLGYPDDAGHPDVQRVIEQSIRRIRAAGKAAGFLAVDPAMAEKCLAWGPTLSPSGWIPCCIPRRWTAGWRCLNPPAPSRRRKRAIDGRLALGSGERLRQHRQRMLAAFAGGHLNLPFAGLAVGDDEVGPLSSI
jgi:2-dehydro-3-deoxy-L-rhamnonate aldolase